MSEYLDLSSGTVHWKDYGGSGQLIVMVHGLGGSVANWDRIGPRLAGRGHVVALDLPGFGLSPPARDWSLDTHRDSIIAFISHFGSPAILFGNSMGGLLAQMVAAARPDLVAGIVLLSPAAPPRLPDPHINWRNARRLLIHSTPGIGPAVSRHLVNTMTPRELINDTLQRVTHKPSRVPIDLIESLVKVAETRSHLPWAADAIPKTGQSIRRMFLKRSRYVAMIRDVRAPTLVVQGLADPIVSPTSVGWACSLRPDWTLVQMEDTGHTPQIDAPVRLLGVVEPWLDSLVIQEMTV
jgi:pimeloyl-ACP methyl ester carboxylesterase